MRFSHSCLEIWSHKTCLASEKMKESRIFYRDRKSGSSTIRKCIFLPKWVNQVSIYRPKSSGYLASFKRSFRGFFTKKSGKHAISHDCAKWKIHQHHFHLPGAFRMTMQNFRMVMWNQFSLFPFELQPKSFMFHFTRLCGFSSCSCEMEKHSFSTPFCHFFNFFLLSPLQLPPNQLQIPIQTDCIASFNFICFLEFDSSLLSPIYQNHTLKWLQDFIKLVSNSCKGNNMLIECFTHNYYSKYVKLMRIII